MCGAETPGLLADAVPELVTCEVDLLGADLVHCSTLGADRPGD